MWGPSDGLPAGPIHLQSQDGGPRLCSCSPCSGESRPYAQLMRRVVFPLRLIRGVISLKPRVILSGCPLVRLCAYQESASRSTWPSLERGWGHWVGGAQALTCVKREVPGEGLLPAKDLPTHGTGVQLLAWPPLRSAVSRVQAHLVPVWKRGSPSVSFSRWLCSQEPGWSASTSPASDPLPPKVTPPIIQPST